MATTSFSFDPKIVKVIDKLQGDIHAGSRSEVLRRAITLLKLSKDAEKNGAELIIRDKDGREQRIIIS
jgi:Arc/MetJ-type ribon-helix-helix transcriptional regulator